MRTAIAISGALCGLGAWQLLRQSSAVEVADGEAPQQVDAPGIDIPNVYDQVKDMIAPTNADQADTNTIAFLAMIRKAEGTDDALGYSALFGHRARKPRTFDSFADHPRLAQAFVSNGKVLYTTAAGAYQFMAVSPLPNGGSTRVNTWDRVAAKLGLADFSPESQDLAAIELIREAGALGDVRAGRFDQAVNKVRGIWASMPGAGYGQPEKALASLQQTYLNAGGTFA